MTDNITLPREVAKFVLQVLEKGVTFKPGWVPECEDAVTALRAHLAAPSEDVEAPRRDAESYQKQKDRNYRLQKLLKECRKVMEANGVFRDTKVHKDLKTRIRIELENKT